MFIAVGPLLWALGFDSDREALRGTSSLPIGVISIKGERVNLPRTLARYVLGVGFVMAGLAHFLQTSKYELVVPPILGHAEFIVYSSGICEIVGGIGSLVRRTRRSAGAGLIALLVAVFPANIYMATHPEMFAGIASPAALLLRLPLQLVLIVWVWWCCF